MTPTAIELWNDVNFCKKRWLEQAIYMRELTSKALSDERFIELFQSAYSVRKKFYYRYRELKAKWKSKEK